MERLDWKLILSLEFSWGMERAGGMEKVTILFRGKMRVKEQFWFATLLEEIGGGKASPESETHLTSLPGSPL